MAAPLPVRAALSLLAQERKLCDTVNGTVYGGHTLTPPSVRLTHILHTLQGAMNACSLSHCHPVTS